MWQIGFTIDKLISLLLVFHRQISDVSIESAVYPIIYLHHTRIPLKWLCIEIVSLFFELPVKKISFYSFHGVFCAESLCSQIKRRIVEKKFLWVYFSQSGSQFIASSKRNITMFFSILISKRCVLRTLYLRKKFHEMNVPMEGDLFNL